MNNCTGLEERLNDYLDGLLSPAGREEVERHLAGCAGCRDALADLRSLREKTEALPREVEPRRDLWPGIRDSLPRRRPPLPEPLAGLPEWLTGWGGLAPTLASVVLLLIIIVAVAAGLRRNWILPGPGPAPVARGEAAPPAAAAALPPGESLEQVEAEYRAATEKLLAALRREGQGAPPEAVKVIEENLKIVDRAIQEIHLAAVEHPDRAADERAVIHLYRTRFELLQQAVRLASQEGKEKKS